MKEAIATDFGTISKESLKRITKWGGGGGGGEILYASIFILSGATDCFTTMEFNI